MLKHTLLVTVNFALQQLKSLLSSVSLAHPWLMRCRLTSVPPEIFSDCTLLFTLSLHNNPITAAALRDLKGFNVFDERRRGKYSKQVRQLVLCQA